LSFKLSDEFVSVFEGKHVPWGNTDAGGNSIGELIFLRTYSRVKADGTKETWPEVCRRVIEGVYSIQKDHCKTNKLPWNDRKAQASAQEAYEMGMVNAVVPHDELEDTAYQWAQEILAKSPTSIKMIKFAMNLTDDGMVGQQIFAGEATRLAYMTDEAKEGRNAFLEKLKPDFKDIKWIP